MIDTAIRSHGIGGSDIAAIVGMDPRRDAFAVYADKLGLIEREPPSPRMVWGKRLERIIAEAYGEETGQRVSWDDTTRCNAERTWQVYTPDAWALDAYGPDARAVGGVDAKNVSFDQAYMWGDGKDAVPEHIALQCQWYMSASRLPWWDVAALFGGCDLHILRVNFDSEIEAVLLEEGERFWRTHVEAQIPPPIGSSATAAEYLRQRFPRNTEAIRPATPEECELLETLKEARRYFATAEAEKIATENALKQAIGDAEGLTWGKEKVTWKRAKDTMGTDWKAVALRLASVIDANPEQYLEQIATEHQIVTREGSRKLIVPRSWGKEE